MEPQSLINIGLGAALAIAGWLCRQMWDAVQQLRRDLHNLEVTLPTAYLKKDEFAENFKEIKDMLNRIFDKLEAKADK